MLVGILWLGMLMGFGGLKGQHLPHFGQYMFNGLVLNPAYAGHKGALDLGLLHRNQWLGFNGAPKTFTFAAHAPSRNGKNNYGVVLGHDRLGPRRGNMLRGMYSYRLFTGDWSVAMGLQGEMGWLSVNYNDLGRESQGDPIAEANYPTVIVPQAGTGLWISHSKFYLGLSAPTLIRVNNSAYDLHFGNAINYRNYFLTTGFILRAAPDILVKPSILVKYTRESPWQVDLNTNVILKEQLNLGLSYRSNGVVLGLMEFYFNEQFRSGISYEWNFGDLSRYQSGSLEFTMGYLFGYKVKTPGLRYF